MSLAALPMYDLPAVRWATDALWAALAATLPGAPATLTRDRPAEAIWTDPDLLLAQTCGYPLVTTLAGKVQVVATPCYEAPGCEGPLYRSAIIVRRDNPAATLGDLRGRRAAVNSVTSNSGMNLFRREIADLAEGRAFFAETVITGAHVASAEAVTSGHADVAAIDAETWALLAATEPEAVGGLRVLAWTRPAPGLPFITSGRTDAAGLLAIRQALEAVIVDPDLAEVRAALRLGGVAPPQDYGVILEIEREAAVLGYAELA
jgi:ABC-type phosphate/phosphonate transport system substrate-binding protein